MGLFSKLLGITEKQQPLHLDDSNFASEVLNSTEPVVIDVWGQRCGHCKQLEPIMMELAAQYRGRVKVCEMAAETSPRTMSQLQIQATPTVLYFKDGKELERVAGFKGSLYHQQSIEELFGIAG
ncbi:MAG: thioredoxin domain-containing protein [Myxococcales bacterium]